MTSSIKTTNNPWWRGGVIYQIYPRSFQDSNGDGIGDLPGITARLDHIAKLGADGIWLSPFFKSPMKDFGYDVTDYCDVDPMFGTLEDFKTLLARAHALGLKVMIDQVLSHTSDQHPWFIESRSSKDNCKADWYVWADAKDDGNPPNNWLSVFGGSSWQWDTRRCQYFLHNFLSSQPDLNFHHPEVQEAILGTVKFWLDLGVDGYRLDTANFYFHDAQLRSNPPRGKPGGSDGAVPLANPYGWQWHHYDKSQPENLVFLQQLRGLLDQYPDTTMVGEIGDDDGLARVAQYTSGGDKLHMAYCFDLLNEDHTALFLHKVLSKFVNVVGDGWPCWALSNHDCVRLATRWGGSEPDGRLLRLAAAFQLCLRGTLCIYQGEELGLPEAQLRFEELQDPYGITMWPEFKGRDGCRTPFPWESSQFQAGFSVAQPWLPLGQLHSEMAVDVQVGSGDSLLNYYARLIHWRRETPVLVSGSLSLLPEHPQVLAFVRTHLGEQMLCVFNFSDTHVQWNIPQEFEQAQGLLNSPAIGGTLIDGSAMLAPWGSLFASIQSSP